MHAKASLLTSIPGSLPLNLEADRSPIGSLMDNYHNFDEMHPGPLYMTLMLSVVKH